MLKMAAKKGACQKQSVTDRQTHRHTTTAYITLSIASRGKNMKRLVGGLC